MSRDPLRPSRWMDGLDRYGILGDKPATTPWGPPIGGFASLRYDPSDPVVMRTRVDVRPPFWQRLREVFWRGPPRPLRLGFVYAPTQPGGAVDLRRLEVSVVAPCGIREIDLEFVCHINGQPVTFYPDTGDADFGERAPGSRECGGAPSDRP